ncbi:MULTISPECIES: Cys-tRNA(Pro) deacylase [Tissierellales]|jgi:Cys-tRNA(Pro)/Cys-tRNA(Cys) deacylase|uniref:Cys-tRNA(Pro)/Cys-tRNA(Cys) deacylase n=1 Tax=Acidilutibacter cellobiosedens TaxID=2507161 RepID=A0A410QGR3_9FIRM|nr:MULTISPECIES: Cys-tRNA(Pro) deacylase [Tissierellales]MBE6081145.1 Cys-tRNA(Pro) deacylase [Tissierellaceae bacterium]QAT63171.1 Cys-tRNA(Pro) deacylase [Acidilutibacter cellobiosedens]SCL86346.1 Cys-tRNA(Pro)/Cys-tRNA(Cys) deacylase YbaK [Sporanaerobacter sp. PP17-6a]
MSNIKTNAMRILDSNDILYNVITYETKDGKIDGLSVAKKSNKDPSLVYKTLVTKGRDNNIFIFVIPVEKELDLKKAAKVCGEKKIDMIHVKDIKKYTGYIRGGCSPIGMKKLYPTFINSTAESLENILVSGGKIGVQIELKVEDLKKVTKAALDDVIE